VVCLVLNPSISVQVLSGLLNVLSLMGRNV